MDAQPSNSHPSFEELHRRQRVARVLGKNSIHSISAQQMEELHNSLEFLNFNVHSFPSKMSGM